MTDTPPNGLRASLDAAMTRRRTLHIVAVTLTVIVAFNVLVVAGVGLLLWSGETERDNDMARREAATQVLHDVYALMNDANARLARIEGRPVPTPLVPPGATTTVPGTTTTVRPTTATTTTRPAAATTTTRPAPPPTTTTSTTRPPATSTTTTTTRPGACLSVPVIAVGCADAKEQRPPRG